MSASSASSELAKRLSPSRFAAVEIRTRGTGRHVDDASIRIDGHDAPGVRAARALRFFEIPRRGGGMGRRIRQRIERPLLRAGDHVEGADGAALQIGRAVVADRGSRR